jgi:Ras GTPase-activating-like protein IQGAP2/3
LNPFIESNKQRINKFLLELCEVGDFYESLEVCFIEFHNF